MSRLHATHDGRPSSRECCRASRWLFNLGEPSAHQLQAPHPTRTVFADSFTTTINRLAAPKATSTCSAGARSPRSSRDAHESIAPAEFSTRRQQLRTHTCAIGRLAESEGPVLFARFEDEAEKCEFIEANAPVETWSPTDDNAGVLIKASPLREQAREVLVSAAR